MKVMRREIELFNFLLRYFDSAFVLSAVQARFDNQSGLCRRPGNEIHDGTLIRQGPATPVRSDEGEEAMLDLVPLAGPRWEMTHGDSQLLFGRKAL